MEAFQKLPGPVQQQFTPLLNQVMKNPYAIANWSVVAAYCLAYVPHFTKFFLMTVNKGAGYNNESPRTEDLQKYKKFPKLMSRLQACHYNNLEMFPFFAAAVLLGRVQKVNPMVLTSLAMKYLVLRVVYVFLYAFGVNPVLAAGRSVVWFSAFNTAVKIAMLSVYN
eukprot:snap_masked-scaffold_4-processed-gene-20.26-mRNA-1 protein AED:0.05 eAED:0.06 QI:0/-1/0/1/-1/1/1/0/165